MMLSMSGVSTLENFLQLVGMVILFVLILIASYFTARFVGTSGAGINKNRNIKVIETYKMGPNKFLQIVQISGKYIVLGISKDSIEFITELEEEQVIIENGEITALSFKEILNNIKNKRVNK